jgi:hypothetical protein
MPRRRPFLTPPAQARPSAVPSSSCGALCRAVLAVLIISALLPTAAAGCPDDCASPSAETCLHTCLSCGDDGIAYPCPRTRTMVIMQSVIFSIVGVGSLVYSWHDWTRVRGTVAPDGVVATVHKVCFAHFALVLAQMVLYIIAYVFEMPGPARRALTQYLPGLTNLTVLAAVVALVSFWITIVAMVSGSAPGFWKSTRARTLFRAVGMLVFVLEMSYRTARTINDTAPFVLSVWVFHFFFFFPQTLKKKKKKKKKKKTHTQLPPPPPAGSSRRTTLPGWWS